MDPRPVIGVGQPGGDLLRQPAQISDLAQHAHPGVRHDTLAVRRHFHPPNRCVTVHLGSASPLGIIDPQEVSLFLLGQALSPTQHHVTRTFHEKSRLAHPRRPERTFQNRETDEAKLLNSGSSCWPCPACPARPARGETFTAARRPLLRRRLPGGRLPQPPQLDPPPRQHLRAVSRPYRRGAVRFVEVDRAGPTSPPTRPRSLGRSPALWRAPGFSPS